MPELYHTVLDRHLIVPVDETNCMPKIVKPFMDETCKQTHAKYVLKNILLDKCIYRLDARSIRYGKRMSINENTKEE